MQHFLTMILVDLVTTFLAMLYVFVFSLIVWYAKHIIDQLIKPKRGVRK